MATTAKKNIPVLRFPGLKEDWVRVSLGEISHAVMYGMNAAAKEFDGLNKYIRITDINDVSRNFDTSSLTSPDGELIEKYILKEGDILFARTGASVGKSYYYRNEDGRVFFAGFLIKFHIKKEEVNPYFVFSTTLKTEYEKWVLKMSMRSGQPGINAEEYKTFEFNIPSLPEQQKIASFLSSVDERLQQLQQQQSLLERYKKGCMQQFFSQKIRFKDSRGKSYPNWKEMTLGNIFENRVEKGANEEAELLSVTINNGVKRHRDLDRINNSSDDKSSYLSVKIGDIVYNSMRMWQGACGVSYWNGIVSPAYTVLKINEGFSNIYFAFLFKLDETIKIFQKHSQGLTSDTWNLKYSKFKNISVIVPSLEEQTKIANFLSAIDEQINNVKQQIAQTQQFKKGLLQQMFV